MFEFHLAPFDTKKQKEKISKMFPKLTAIEVGECDEAALVLRDQLLILNSKQLLSIEFDDLHDTAATRRIDYPKLEELTLWYPESETLDKLLCNSRMKCLKRVCIQYLRSAHDWEWDQVFIQNPQLEWLSLRTETSSYEQGQSNELVQVPPYEKFEKVMGSLERALYALKSAKRQRLCIRIEADINKNDEKKLIPIHVFRMVNAFSMSNIEDYIFEFDHMRPGLDKTVLKGLQEKYKDSHLVYVASQSLFIKNISCKISGDRPRWVFG